MIVPSLACGPHMIQEERETGERPLPQASVLSGPIPRTGCAAVLLLPLPLLQHWAWETLRNQSSPSLRPPPALLPFFTLLMPYNPS
ncbi:hypothetical protein SRHO_G00290960 [Serrasalmus rhombeus]